MLYRTSKPKSMSNSRDNYRAMRMQTLLQKKQIVSTNLQRANYISSTYGKSQLELKNICKPWRTKGTLKVNLKRIINKSKKKRTTQLEEAEYLFYLHRAKHIFEGSRSKYLLLPLGEKEQP